MEVVKKDSVMADGIEYSRKEYNPSELELAQVTHILANYPSACRDTQKSVMIMFPM